MAESTGASFNVAITSLPGAYIKSPPFFSWTKSDHRKIGILPSCARATQGESIMSLSPNTNDPEDREVHKVKADVPIWIPQLVRPPPRRKKWMLAPSGATWFDWRDFGTVGFCERGPDGCALYVDTAVPVFVTAGNACMIAWPRTKNWMHLEKTVLPEQVKTMRSPLPIFKKIRDAWTFFVEHYCWTRVALFEVQHGKCTAYVPVAQLSSGKFCTRLQDRFFSFEEAKRTIFSSLAFFFVTTEPQICIDETGKNISHIETVQQLHGFWQTKKPPDVFCPFEFSPVFYRWTGTSWKKSKFRIQIDVPETRLSNSEATIVVKMSVPNHLSISDVQISVVETFNFNKFMKNAGLKKFHTAKVEKAPDGQTVATLTLWVADYASAFVSVKSQPWAYLPLFIRFQQDHPDILVLGVVTPRYMRGDLRTGSLYCAKTFHKKTYYSIPHTQNTETESSASRSNPPHHPNRAKKEIARFIDADGVMTSVMAAEAGHSKVLNPTTLCPGEALVLLTLLASMQTTILTKRGEKQIPMYPRTSVIYPINSMLAASMSPETKLDHCAILKSPLWRGESQHR